MPFTPTHVAAIVPFAWLGRQRLPFSALVIGSMIPDLHMFVPTWMPITFNLVHTVPGLVAGCLPLGMLLFLWFQLFAKQPLAALLPPSIRSRLHPHELPHIRSSFRFLAAVCVALVLGAATHLLWDSFTHCDRWGYRLLPNPTAIVLRVGDYSLEFYKALQHGSTVVFLPLLAFSGIWWISQRESQEIGPEQLSTTVRWSWGVATCLMPSLLALGLCLARWGTFVSLGDFAKECVTTAGLFTFVVVNLYAGWFWKSRLHGC